METPVSAADEKWNQFCATTFPVAPGPVIETSVLPPVNSSPRITQFGALAIESNVQVVCAVLSRTRGEEKMLVKDGTVVPSMVTASVTAGSWADVSVMNQPALKVIVSAPGAAFASM